MRQGQEIPARHVFHSATTGLDRVHAWQEATHEPVFIWGRGSGLGDATFFRPLKRAFSQWIEGTGGENAMTIYHDGIGSDAFGPLDPSTDKILFLHHWFPRWHQQFEWCLRCTGKVMVGRRDLVDQLREAFGWIPERFIAEVPGPLLGGLNDTANGARAPVSRTGIWLQGKAWKRFGNRLRSVADRWDYRNGELEIITEGKTMPSWASREGLTWSANLPTEFALNRIFTWDSVLVLNDHNLDSPWLLRALLLDCFPLIPDGDGPARAGPWLADSAPRPYKWGDIKDANSLLSEWRDSREDLLPSFQKWRESITGQHADASAFEPLWQGVKASLREQRSPKLRVRKPIGDWQLLSWYERVFRLRSGSSV